LSEQQKLFTVAEEPPLSRKDKKRQQYLAPINPATLSQIWELYVSTMWSGRGRKPRLTEERAKIITVAVNQYGATEVKNAVRGCALSPWHMGQNPSGTLYNSIELILRDAEHIERFARLSSSQDNKGGFLDDED
jgi:hypothetical protein